jgi:hypothetical protein
MRHAFPVTAAEVAALVRGGFVVEASYASATPRLYVDLGTPAGRDQGEALLAIRRDAGGRRRRYRTQELRVVSNRTRDYDGGYSVEARAGSVLAGPYAAKDDAKRAKIDLVAGRLPR